MIETMLEKLEMM